ncbi:hypothetical protein DUNSADRAFT_12081, partial [Dunaliella salina]
MGVGPCKGSVTLAHDGPTTSSNQDAGANKIDDKTVPQNPILPTSNSVPIRLGQTEMQQHDLQERAKVIKKHFPKALALE